MQVILVYLLPFRRSLLLKCALQPKIAKNFTKTTFFESSKSFKVIDVDKSESPSPVLVIMCSKSVPICNRFHIIRANSGKITSFKGVFLFDALVRREPPHPGARNFVIKNWSF